MQTKIKFNPNHDIDEVTHYVENNTYGEMSWTQRECLVCGLEEWLINKWNYSCK
jgi:hypothetical protein